MSEIKELAKFFDTHGSVGLYPQDSGGIKVRVAIVKASPVSLKRFRDYFKVGTLAGYPQLPPYRYYTFCAYAQNARIVLDELLPYLEYKRRPAELALEALSMRRIDGSKYTPSEVARFKELAQESRATVKEHTLAS